MTRPPDPPEAPIYFFGCRYGMGHFLHVPGTTRHWIETPRECPWTIGDLERQPSEYQDGVSLLPRVVRQSSAALTHFSGWSALAMHDFTVDTRGNSKATFIVPERALTAPEILALATEHFPDVVSRLGTITGVQL